MVSSIMALVTDLLVDFQVLKMISTDFAPSTTACDSYRNFPRGDFFFVKVSIFKYRTEYNFPKSILFELSSTSTV